MEQNPYNWLQYYPKSIPTTINPYKYTSIATFFDEIFKKYSELAMCENMGKCITYKNMEVLSRNFAAYLQHYTTLPIGSHVAIQLPNLLQYPVALLGLLRAGMVVVNLNPLYTPHEMAYQLKDANVSAVVVLENFAHKLTNIIPQTSIKTIIITKVGDLLGTFKGSIVNFTVKHIKKLVPLYKLPGAVTFKKVLQSGSKVLFTHRVIKATDIAFLQYTGGTTGISKGAVLTHGNIMANIAQMSPFFALKLEKGKEVIIIPLPLYHIFALSGLLHMSYLGAKSVLITNPRDINFFVKELKKHRFSGIIGINTLFERLLANKKFARLNFSYLKLTAAGGIKTQPAVIKKWTKVTGNQLAEAYGLTEASPGITVNILDGVNHIPLPNTAMKIVNDEGREVPYGTAGEIWVQGPQVMSGYWEKPTETAQVFQDEWLKTGDIGVISEEGYMEIVDRKKDMINVSGFNVYPNEIEHIVSGHPKVLEVGAIGVADMSFKEAVKIFVVKKDPTLTAEELIAYCKERLTQYKIPKYVEFKNSLPKSNIGKILRRLLKDWKDE